ncbi:MAG: adenine phosphoribosyltransferase [Proteobacteria bacterium]|nr:adenine phosphoribosyltransferase [Pseudomonadota bacterium]
MTADLASLIATAPDFPKPGILFRDISPLLAAQFPRAVTDMAALFADEELAAIDAFAGIDARGYIFAAALAARLNKNFVMLRKGGKLPQPYAEKEYDLEYGTAKLQLKTGTGRIVVVDDVVATGGTLAAAADLCRDAGYTVTGFAALIDIVFLNSFSWNGLRVRSLIQYEAAA